MATDATGTPTSPDSLPKFNTSVDAPSGLGTNAMMDSIQAALTSRPAAPVGVASGEAMVWNGSAWVRSSVTKLGTGSLSGYPWANADIAIAAGIAYSKLALTGSVVDADIASAAAIAASKLAGYPTDATKFLRGDGAWASASPVRYRKNTAKQVVSSVAETDLLNGEITVAANAMGTSGALRLTAVGDLLNNSGAVQTSPRFKLKLGATTLLDTGVISASWTTGTGRLGWKISVDILNLTAASQWSTFDAKLAGTWLSNVSTFFATGEGATGSDAVNHLFAIGGGASAVDTTLAQALALSVTLPVSNAAVDVTLKGALVEIL